MAAFCPAAKASTIEILCPNSLSLSVCVSRHYQSWSHNGEYAIVCFPSHCRNDWRKLGYVTFHKRILDVKHIQRRHPYLLVYYCKVFLFLFCVLLCPLFAVRHRSHLLRGNSCWPLFKRQMGKTWLHRSRCLRNGSMLLLLLQLRLKYRCDSWGKRIERWIDLWSTRWRPLNFGGKYVYLLRLSVALHSL